VESRSPQRQRGRDSSRFRFEASLFKEVGVVTQNRQAQPRVVVTKDLPGAAWFEALAGAGCTVDICDPDQVSSRVDLKRVIGGNCDAVIGQLTERWDSDLLASLKDAGGRVYSNYAVGYDNVDVAAATGYGIAVGNTPGVLTEATAELAVALTFSAARRVTESNRFLLDGLFKGWEPSLLLGEQLTRKKLGVVGVGRIGATYARMMVAGFKLDLIYYDLAANESLEGFVRDYADFLARQGQEVVTCRRADSLDELLREADIVSLHISLNDETRHIIDGSRLLQMKSNAVLVNTARGSLLDEVALVEHCRKYPSFRAGLDVFEHEPRMTSGLDQLPNIVALPHLGSATGYAREGMATLAALNVVGVLNDWPVWAGGDVRSFLSDQPPTAAPSIVNAAALGRRFVAAE
jgi:hydroxypyruvate reductase 1